MVRIWDHLRPMDNERAYREQIARLYERSSFYRDKLRAAGFGDAAAVGGLDAIAKRTPVPEVSIGLVVSHGSKSAPFTIAGGQTGTTIQKGERPCKGSLEAPFDAVLQIIGRSVSLEEAVASARAKVQGSATLVRKLPQLFDLAERRRPPAG